MKSNLKKKKLPLDGQKCLDYSVPHLDKNGKIVSKHRYSIEENNFITLKYTAHRRYHSQLIKWHEMPMGVKDIFKKQGCVKRKGKIMKQLTEISPL